MPSSDDPSTNDIQIDAPSTASWLSLWVNLNPGVTKVNLWAFFYASFLTIASYTFVNIGQTLILQQILDYDDDSLGKATGDLGFYNELMIIAVVWPWGVLSDKMGRRAVFVFGFLIMGVGFIIMPFVTSYGMLVGFRLVWAVGAAATASVLASVMADYVTKVDIGKASGWMGVFSGCGALLAALVLVQIPVWVSGWIEGIAATRFMYEVTAGVMLLSGVLLLFFMQGKTSIQKNNQREAPHKLLIQGLKAAARDKRLTLAYAASYTARGDAVVLTTFFSLWIQDYMTDQGFSEEEAASKAGQITGYAQTAALVSSVGFGYMATKMNIILATAISASIAFIGYGSFIFITDPTSTEAILCGCIVGMGEIGVIVTAQAVTARFAPTKSRGSVSGVAGLFGSIGILFCTKVGGILYDSWMPSAPFILFAIFNAIVIGWALVVYYFYRNEDDKALADEEESAQPLLIPPEEPETP